MNKNQETHDPTVDNILQNIEKQFHLLNSKRHFEKVLKDLQKILQTLNSPLDTTRDQVIEMIRKIHININYFNRYEELRSRFIDGEDESVYEDLIKLNSELFQSDNYFVTPKLLELTQKFLERIANLVNAKKLDDKQKYGNKISLIHEMYNEHTFMPSLGTETTIQRNEEDNVNTIPPAQLPSIFKPIVPSEPESPIHSSEIVPEKDFQTIPPALLEKQKDNLMECPFKIGDTPFSSNPFPSPKEFPDPFPAKPFEIPYTYRVTDPKSEKKNEQFEAKDNPIILDNSPDKLAFESPFDVKESKSKLKPNPYSATYAMEIMQKLVEKNSKVMNPDEEDSLELI